MAALIQAGGAGAITIGSALTVASAPVEEALVIVKEQGILNQRKEESRAEEVERARQQVFAFAARLEAEEQKKQSQVSNIEQSMATSARRQLAGFPTPAPTSAPREETVAPKATPESMHGSQHNRKNDKDARNSTSDRRPPAEDKKLETNIDNPPTTTTKQVKSTKSPNAAAQEANVKDGNNAGQTTNQKESDKVQKTVKKMSGMLEDNRGLVLLGLGLVAVFVLSR